LVVLIFTLCAATIVVLTDTDTASLGHAALPFIDLDQRGGVVALMIHRLKNSAQTFCSNETALLLCGFSDLAQARVNLKVGMPGAAAAGAPGMGRDSSRRPHTAGDPPT